MIERFAFLGLAVVVLAALRKRRKRMSKAA